MKALVKYIIRGIIGSNDFEISESTNDDVVDLVAKVKADHIGLIIGKSGKTIRSIRNVLRVKATLKGKKVNLSVEEA